MWTIAHNGTLTIWNYDPWQLLFESQTHTSDSHTNVTRIDLVIPQQFYKQKQFAKNEILTQTIDYTSSMGRDISICWYKFYRWETSHWPLEDCLWCQVNNYSYSSTTQRDSPYLLIECYTVNRESIENNHIVSDRPDIHFLCNWMSSVGISDSIKIKSWWILFRWLMNKKCIVS